MGIDRRAVALALALAIVVSLALDTRAAAGGTRDDVGYEPPVDAPVVDPFRRPSTPYGPGNRGLTYDLAPGTAVRASASGTVVFAGPVARTRHVTIRHADGLRTSYSFLHSVSVRRGQRVRRGEVVGAAGAGFHFGVRDGDTYLDPALLFGRIEIRVWLVPHSEPLPPGRESLRRERTALAEVVRQQGLLERGARWLVRTGTSAVASTGAVLHVLRELQPVDMAADVTGALLAGIRRDRNCTPASTMTGASVGAGRSVVLVGGYGSTSDDAAIDGVDTSALGYDPGHVVRYSYAGGRVPGDEVGPELAALPSSPYAAADTHGDLLAEGADLASLVEAASAARAGAPVDVFAHSQGGIVTRLALAELERRGRLHTVGTVVTIGTPHRGADLATAGLLLDGIEQRAVDAILAPSGVDAGAVSVTQMAETSALVLGLDRDGIPRGVDFRTIGATGDLVVTADKTHVDGVPAAIVPLHGPTAHDQLPADPRTTRELALALAGRPPTCRGAAGIVADAVVPEVLSSVQTALSVPFLL